jgi:ribose-phosphate pyrophosphokinase
MVLNLADFANSQVKYKLTHYPDSHTHIDLQGPAPEEDGWENITIKTRLSTLDDVFILLQATEQLRKMRGGVHLDLVISYLLTGRYDRPMHEGDSFDLKIITEQIQSRGYDSITLYEPHSDISTVLLEAKAVHPLDATLKKWLQPYLDEKGLAYNKVCIVAPDIGSVKRVQAFVKTLKRTIPVAVANKTRNTDGEVTGIEILNQHELREKVFIYDDLCDGGRTFIEIAKLIKKAKPECFITLVVTHGIFSKGFKVILGDIEQIITTNSYADIEQYDDLRGYADCVHIEKVI